MKTGSGRTDTGLVRQNNQDSIYVRNESIGGLQNLYIIADGMGGHKAGEVASSLAVQFFLEFLETEPAPVEPEFEDYLRRGVSYANSNVFSFAQTDNSRSGMGTTFSMCTIYGDTLYYAHVGDSRVYTAIGNEMRLLSRDHSYVAEMVRDGKLTEAEAGRHPGRNVLTRALGTEENVAVDTGRHKLLPDEQVLLCSDGLTNMIDDQEILKVMQCDTTADEKSEVLVSLALKNGGVDNVSVIVIC